MGFELGSVKQSHWAGAEPGLIFTVPPWSAVWRVTQGSSVIRVMGHSIGYTQNIPFGVVF